jgi:hypothetical protein
MTVQEHIDTIAARSAGELIVELFGSSFYQLTAQQQASYLAEIVMHIRDWLTHELETALGVIRDEQPTPSAWADQDEFNRIVATNFPKV